MAQLHDFCREDRYKWNYGLRDQRDDPAIPIKFDNVFKSSDGGKGICQKCDARSEFLFFAC